MATPEGREPLAATPEERKSESQEVEAADALIGPGHTFGTVNDKIGAVVLMRWFRSAAAS